MSYVSAAAQALRAKQYQQAEALCRQGLATNPRDAGCLNLLGVLGGLAGQHAQAAGYLRQAAALWPNEASVLRNLATSLIALREFAEAEQVLLAALRQAPQDPRTLAQLGTVLAELGRREEGVQQLEASLALDPHSAYAHFNLGEIHRRSGNSRQAQEHLERSVELEPGRVDALNNLAGIQLEQMDYLAALRSIQRVLQLQPRSVQAYCNLATVMQAAGDAEQAVVAARNAMLLDPQAVRPKVLLAGLLVALSDVGQAEPLVQELRDREPDNLGLRILQAKVLEHQGKLDEALALLSVDSNTGPAEPELALTRAIIAEQQGDVDRAVRELEDILQTNHTVATQGVGVQFALGQCYDSLERFDEAFEMYRQGNEHRRRAFLELKSDRTRQQFNDGLIDAYSRDAFDRSASATVKTDVPIFIVGMPRSGTSLTEQILGRHPDVFAAGELSALREQIHGTYAASVRRQQQLEIVDIDPSGQYGCLVPKGWPDLPVDLINGLTQGYLDEIRRLHPTARHITDKMPLNYAVLPAIAKMFPGSPILHTRRHPLDTCLSCYFQNFTNGHQYAFDLSELGDFYRQYVRLMAHYRDQLRIPLFEVNYEELVTRPEPVVRQILDYCGLDWHEGCLHPHEDRRVVKTASYQQVRRPIYQSSVGRWRHYRQHLEPLLEALGPDLVSELGI